MVESRIWSDFIFDLKSKSDIVEVISSYLQVTQKGKGYWALCPFHNDRNPSMSINKEGQYYHCFVCNAGGDVITFVQNYESCTFMEAVEILAKRARMEVPQISSTPDKEIAERKRLKDECISTCLIAAKYYNAKLWQRGGEYALQYLKKRGLTPETIKRFGLGLSTDWDSLCDEFKSKNIDMTIPTKAGLIIRKEDGRYFDCMANRLIVPIFDVNGNVIAFGGRTFSTDKSVAKYKNTSVTPIFDKSKVLYALNFAKKAKQKGNLDYLIIVEGYMDVIALHQAGFTQAVASMGTSLTEEQARQAKRLTNNIYICYDGDSAGQNATLRGLDILKKEGLDVKIVSLPDGVDPDEYVKANGVEGFRKLLSTALPLIDYKLSMAKRALYPKEETKASILEYRRNYATRALEILRPLSEIDRESYLPTIVSETKMNVEFLRRQFSDATISQEVVLDDGQAVGQDLKAIANVLACKLYGYDFANDDFEYISEDLLFNEIFEALKQSKVSGRKMQVGDLYRLENAEIQKESLKLLVEISYDDDKRAKIAYEDCVNLLRKKQFQQKIAELKEKYSITEYDEERKHISREIMQLMYKMNLRG